MFKRKTSEELKTYLANKEELRVIKAQNRDKKKTNKSNEKERRKERINTHKINRLKERERAAKEKELVTNKSHHFRWYNFFTRWFLLGIILVCTSLCVSLISNTFIPDEHEFGKVAMSLLAGILSTVGIALFVGCIFDFSKNSEAFMEFVSKILSDIIISKTFLTSLAAGDKKDALKLILQPSNKQIEQYSNINEYFKKKIDDYMKMFDKNFKTNLTLDIEAKKDTEMPDTHKEVSGICYVQSDLIRYCSKILYDMEELQ